jgi:carboxypeptidase Q
MMRRLILLAGLVLAAPLSAQTVDTTGVGALIREGTERSMAMKDLQHLSDMIGPRLSGSAAMKQANDWTAQKFKEYGLTATQEKYPFGVTWERGPASATLLAPFKRNVQVWSWAWTEGTGGKPLTGNIVRIDIPNAAAITANAARLKGAWVMLNDPPMIWNPDGPAMTAADSAAAKAETDRRQAAMRALNADTSQAARDARQQFQIDRPYLLKKAGVLGTITGGAKEHGLITMSGSPLRVSPLPNVVVTNEDYSMFARQIAAGSTPRITISVANTVGKTPVDGWNTIGEIKGTEHPDEVVILGAHLDSWDAAQGVTDNGTGSIAVLEAGRIIAQSGLKPKRTIRFILFSGEEEGLMGSRAYAAAHASEADKIQAVMVLDNGTGMIVGQALQGRNQDEQLWKDLLAPVASLGAATVRQGNKGGTDHLSFIPYGVPGWNFDQERRGYNHTHHSQSDSFDKAVPGDMVQASTVMAVTAWELANLPVLLPRGNKGNVTPQSVAKPSPGLAK